MDQQFTSFKNRLDETHVWPSPYLFKFVVPEPKRAELLELLPEGPREERASRNQKYVSISIHATMQNSDEVVDVYRRIAVIEGIVTL